MFKGRFSRSAEFGLRSKEIKSPPKERRFMTLSEKWENAIQKNNFSEAEDLVNVFRNSLHSNHNHALRYACRHGDSRLPIIQLMLLRGADPSVLDGEALVDATSRGHYYVVRTLTKNSGLVVDPSCQNYLPYYSAAYHGHFHILEFFIKEYGKPPTEIIQSILLNLKGNDNLTRSEELLLNS